MNYLAAPRPTLTPNGTLNKKRIYTQNDATVSQLRYKCYGCFQTFFIVNYHINLSYIKDLIHILIYLTLFLT